jgi:hypothetical protein
MLNRKSPRREPVTADHMLDVLRDDLFAAPQWALFANVRSATGADVPGLRIADSIAVDTRPGPGLSLHGIEAKRSQKDLAVELADPSKADEIGRFCEFFSLLVPAPAKNVLGSRLSLPRRWGLIEVSGPRATVLHHAEPRMAEPPPDGFFKALLRAAATRAVREATGEDDAPPQPIVARIDRAFVALGCNHHALSPLQKPPPRTVPCYSCLAGLPPDADAVAARLEAMDLDKLDVFAAVIQRRRPDLRLSGPGIAAPLDVRALELGDARGAA